MCMALGVRICRKAFVLVCSRTNPEGSILRLSWEESRLPKRTTGVGGHTPRAKAFRRLRGRTPAKATYSFVLLLLKVATKEMLEDL